MSGLLYQIEAQLDEFAKRVKIERKNKRRAKDKASRNKTAKWTSRKAVYELQKRMARLFPGRESEYEVFYSRKDNQIFVKYQRDLFYRCTKRIPIRSGRFSICYIMPRI